MMPGKSGAAGAAFTMQVAVCTAVRPCHAILHHSAIAHVNIRMKRH